MRGRGKERRVDAMSTDRDRELPDLFQTLLELEFGLIEGEEASTLRRRIAEEATVARVHADVLRAKESLSEAARVRTAPISHATTARTKFARPFRPRRWIQSASAIAASICLLAVGGVWAWHFLAVHNLQENRVALDFVGPATLRADVPNSFEVIAQTKDQQPIVAADFDLVLTNMDGGELYRQRAVTDEAGRAQFRVSQDALVAEVREVRVEPVDEAQSSIVASLESEPVRPIVRLSTDRPVYQPGETLYYRALVLEPLDLRPASAGQVEFTLLDPAGQLVPGSRHEAALERGVGSGSFVIPKGQNGGVHEIKVHSREGRFDDAKVEIVIRDYRPPRFQKELEFTRDSYNEGEEVTADLSVANVDGRPAANARVTIRATLDGNVFHESTSFTKDDGTLRLVFPLPAEIAKGDGVLFVTIDDGAVQESIVKEIPLALSAIDLAFLPESGVLVAGIENRVYFQALDANEKPVHVHGRIVDEFGQAQAEFETARDGMGRFAMTPQAMAKYQVALVSPANALASATFPTPTGDVALLNTGTGVFPSDSALTFEVRSTRADVPLVIGVACRGIPVAHRLLETAAGAETVSVDLPPEASGVLRITAFDRSMSPPRPIAERLVYREPSRRLEVSISSASELATPGDDGKAAIRVQDEAGNPASGVVLGVSVVDRSSVSLLDKKTTSQDTHFFLTSQIAHPTDLENANYFLDDDPASAKALDLVLGTHGWRTFHAPEDVGAQANPEAHNHRRGDPVEQVESAAVESMPLIANNSSQIRQYEREHRARLDQRRNAILVTLLGALAAFTGAFVASRFLTTWRRLAWALAFVAIVLLVVGVLFTQIIGSGETVDRASPGMLEVAEQKATEKVEATVTGQVTATPMADEAGAIPPTAEAARLELHAAPPPAPAEPELAVGGRAAGMLADAPGGPPGPSDGQPAMKAEAAPTRYFRKRDGDRLKDDVRNNFTQTVYWNPLLLTDENGQASATFQLSDAVTTFDIRVDGHSQEGRLGSGSGEIVSRLPLRVEPKLPIELGAGDRVDIPVAVYNQSARPLDVEIAAGNDGGWKWLEAPTLTVFLEAGESKRVYLPAQANEIDGAATLTLVATSGDFIDRFEQQVQVTPRGFPWEIARSGRVSPGADAILSFRIPEDYLPDSLTTSLRVYADPVREMLDGVESMAREPYGCFEQASSSNYPNVLVLQYLERNGLARPEITRRCREMLDRGYTRLIGFECKERGFEWFGREPGHLALSAYGLLQFQDMSRVFAVDASLLDRTRTWLLDRRLGDGRYRVSEGSLDSFGRAPADVTDAYVTWALVEAGTRGLDHEIEYALQLAETTDNPYILALAAGTLMESKGKDENTESWAKDAVPILDRLATMQARDGSLMATAPSITMSTGESLRTETTALAALAWLKSDRHAGNAEKAIAWLTSNRGADGGFATTQATILALKALVASAEKSADAPTVGAVSLQMLQAAADGAPRLRTLSTGELADTDARRFVDLENFAPYLKAGDNTIQLHSDATGEVRFAGGVRYRTATAVSSDECVVALTTKLDRMECQVGDNVALSVRVVNRKSAAQPMTIAIVGLPAGLEATTEVLDRLRCDGIVDYYETRPREVIFYWLGLKAEASLDLTLDLVATAPGKFTAPPSRAYLYYTPEFKTWVDPLPISIQR